MHIPRRLWLGAALASVWALAACAVNPVTGKSDFMLYGPDWERQVGAQSYLPMRQAQGGDFILDPELTTYVQEVGERLATRARRKDQLDFEFSILNDSVPNAWALPGGKIAVNRGLLTQLDSEAELAAVLGHEIVHADAAHGARAQSKGLLTQAGAALTMVVLGSTIKSQSTREVAMMVPALGAQMLTQKYGRDAEREADEYGMRYMSEAGYDPQGAVKLQETFVKLAEGREEDWLSGLFASHPPSRERVKNNRSMAARLPAGGEIGRERYLEKTAYLRRVEPAYAAYDEAKKDLADDDIEGARDKLRRALSIEPRESLFHDLQGDILAMEEKPEEALAAYRKAVELNPGFFYGYLRRGQMEYRLGRSAAARGSLEHSLKLMPTAEAHYLLGMLDRKAGRLDGARQHFSAAARTESETGKRAAGELLRLDLPDNAAKWVPVRATVDTYNSVWVLFGNRAHLPLRDIEFEYAWLDDQGRTRQATARYAGPLPAGHQGRIKLGFTLASPDEIGQRVRVAVRSAAIAE